MFKFCTEAKSKSTLKEQAAYVKDKLDNLKVCEGKGDNSTWCPFSMDCINRGEPCTLEKSFYPKRSTKLPWGQNCPHSSATYTQTYYCPFVGHCIEPNVNCSLQLIVDWIKSNRLVVFELGYTREFNFMCGKI